LNPPINLQRAYSRIATLLLALAFCFNSQALAVGPVVSGSMTTGQPSTQPGGTIDYTVTITNTGGATAGSVTFTNPAPTNTTDVGSFTVSPLAFPDAYNAIKNTVLHVNAPGVLANDKGVPSPTAVAVTGAPTSGGGTITLNADGSFDYTPSADFNGQDSFTYTLTNGNLTDVATAVITVDPVNDAPILSGSNNFATIVASQTSNSGDLVSTLISGYVSEVDSGAVNGIAIFSLSSGNGTWQYSTDNCSIWTNVGTVSAIAALVL